VIAILASVILAAGVASEPRQCQIDVKMTKPDLTAPRSAQLRDRVISEPRIVTLFGRPACFRAGGLEAILGEISGITGPGVGELVSGVEVWVSPLKRPDGRIRLEVRVAPARSEPGPAVVIDRRSGEKYRFRGPEGMWIEVTATELRSEK
jgi:hypothetical protein